MLKLLTPLRNPVETQPSRYGRLPWALAAVSLAGLVCLAVPADRIRLGAAQLRGLVGTYAYRAPVPLPPVTGLRVTEVYLPGNLRIEWDDMAIPNAHYILRRINPATGAVLNMQPTTETYWEEEVNLGTTTVFEYWVTLAPDSGESGGGGEPPPPGATDIEYYPVVGPDSKLRFRVEDVPGSDNQTVDSRYDLRYGNPTFLDFQFKNNAYQGGLFVGYANDPSRVARSFVKFPLPAGIEDGVFLNGSINAYATGLLTGQSVEVGAQKVSDAAWNPLTLKWTTAPAVNPMDAPYRHNFLGAGWGHWSLTEDIADAEGGSDPLSIALASTEEGSSGRWVYLAKKEFDPSRRARVLIARHYPGDVPAASSLAVTAVTSTTVSLTWNNPIAMGVSVLQMREGNGAWQDVATEAHSEPFGWWGGGPTFPKSPLGGLADGLTPDTQYQFRVKCETQTYGDYYSQRVTATTAP